MRGDLRKEILSILEGRDPSNRGFRWSDLSSALEEQSSIVRRSADLSHHALIGRFDLSPLRLLNCLKLSKHWSLMGPYELRENAIVA